jgi:hypothetical protein
MEFTCTLVRDPNSFAALTTANCATTDAINAGAEFVNTAKGWTYDRLDETNRDYLIAHFVGPDNNGVAIYHQDVDHWNRALALYGVKVAT